MPTQSQFDGQRLKEAERLETFVYPGRRESVGQARRALSKTLCGWGFEQIADDVIVCLSEAVTNALRYGTPGQDLTVRASAVGHTVHVEVDDGSDTVPRLVVPTEVAGQAALAQVALDGRGLLLITKLSDRWGVRPLSPGKTVWFEKRNAGSARVFDRNLVLDGMPLSVRTQSCWDWAEQHGIRVVDEHIAWGANAHTARPAELVEAVEQCAAEGSALIIYSDVTLSADPDTVRWAREAMGDLAIHVMPRMADRIRSS